MLYRRLKIVPAAVVAAAAMGISVPAHSNTFTGYIEVNNSSTFVSNTFNGFGEYITTTNLANALTVSFTPTSSPFSMTATNNPGSAAFPFVGGIRGFPDSSSNLGSGNSNFTYLGGTTSTAPGATPAPGPNSFTAATGISEDIETAIWSISASNILTGQWINTDGSKPTTFIITSTAQGNEVLLTGDPTAFVNSFGSATLDTLTFVCTAPGGCAQESATPLPAALPLFAGGLGALGFLGWRRKRKGAAEATT
jgi:hypothetical protein